MKRSIIVKVDIEALHQWTGCDLPQVSYLAHLHRHTFQILSEIEVTHGDRDVEFIDLKHKIKKYVKEKWYDVTYECCNFNSMSCEHIAEDILIEFNLNKCSVSEDGEFWGVVELEKD